MGETVDIASTYCSLKTFPNQKIFTLRWDIENCLQFFCSKPLEAQFGSSSHAGTCYLHKNGTCLTFEINVKFQFFCTVAFCNNIKKVLHKDSGESSAYDDSFDDYTFTCSIDFNTLQILPNDRLLIVCNVAKNEARTVTYKYNHWSYLRELILIVKTQPAFLLEKVELRIGDDTESVNKAVLCENSKFFADIFKNDENHSNIIQLDGIEFPVLKHAVAFLNSGVLQCDDIESVCSLYCAAGKWGIKSLQDACSRLLELKISVQTFSRVFALSEQHKDFQLKNQALSFFKDHSESVLVTNHWGNLMRDKVELGLQAIAYKLQSELDE